MSVIVAIKQNNKVYIGADSQVTRGGTRSTLKNPNNYKIWKVRGVDHCLMGHVGVLRDANVVRLMDGLVTDYEAYKNLINYELVVQKIVPDIYDALKQRGFISFDEQNSSINSRFIFAYKDQLFVIGSDASVIEVDDYVAIGSGEDQAIGSLLSTENEEPKTRILKAIKASAVSDIYVDYPIIISDSEQTEFEIIYEKDDKK